MRLRSRSRDARSDGMRISLTPGCLGSAFISRTYCDMRTLSMALMNTTWQRSTKRHMPKAWFDPFPHNHVALDDAIEQGAMFCNMLAELRRRGSRAA